jgi:dystroglycan 1
MAQPGLFCTQVLGASEEPTQFSLTNAAGTHATSEGISSPTPGELVFSSFHTLLSGPYFWSLPSRFRGDKVGKGSKGKGAVSSRNHTGKGLGAGVSWALEEE